MRNSAVQKARRLLEQEYFNPDPQIKHYVKHITIQTGLPRPVVEQMRRDLRARIRRSCR